MISCLMEINKCQSESNYSIQFYDTLPDFSILFLFHIIKLPQKFDTEIIPRTNNHTKECENEKGLLWKNQQLPSLLTLLKLVAQVLGLPLSSPNVNADFLRQGTVSETIALLVLLGAEKQNLFRSMFVKNSMFSTSTKVNRPVATAELGKLLGGPCGSWDFYMSEQSPSAL